MFLATAVYHHIGGFKLVGPGMMLWPGFYVGLIAVAYAVPRFFLDMLRREVDNPRYAALTPAHWACILTFAIGVVLLVKARRFGPPLPYVSVAA